MEMKFSIMSLFLLTMALILLAGCGGGTALLLPTYTPSPTYTHAPVIIEEVVVGQVVVTPAYTPLRTATPTPIPTLTPPFTSTHIETSTTRSRLTPTPSPRQVRTPSLAGISSPTPVPQPTATANPVGSLATPTNALVQQKTLFGRMRCPTVEPEREFEYFPINPKDIDVIGPMGFMGGSHVTPVNHIYITHAQWGTLEPTIDVVVPANGTLLTIQQMPSYFSHQREDYFIVIAHSCTLFTVFTHAGALAPDLRDKVGMLGAGEGWNGAIPVAAGQKITNASNMTLDMMVVDTTSTLSGFVVPDSYRTESWKVHVVDPFDFYLDPLRAELLKLNPRKALPLGGKIDYDKEGFLVGNWFIDGTPGYNNTVRENWKGHLAFAYDYIDPDQVRISIGDGVVEMNERCPLCGGVFAVEGNRPDPADIDQESGLVKIELVELVRESGASLSSIGLDAKPLGTLLVQVLGDRAIMFELFPGFEKDAVHAFSDKAKRYNR